MKKQWAVVMGLMLLSATGIVKADEASLQSDKKDLKQDIRADEKGVVQADAKIDRDKAAVQEHNEGVKTSKKALNHHAKQRTKDKAQLKDAKMEGDHEGVADEKADLHKDQKAINRDAADLKEHRDQRDVKVDQLKADHKHRRTHVKNLNADQKELDKTNEKIDEKKQDAVAK